MASSIQISFQIEIISNNNHSHWENYDQLVQLSVDHRINQNSIWYSSYINNYIHQDQVRFIITRSASELTSCIPLQLIFKKGTRFWDQRNFQILGKGPTDFFTVPVKPGFESKMASSLADYFNKNRGNWEHLVLSEMPESEQQYLIIKEKFENLGYQCKLESLNGFYYVDTTQNWDDYFDSYVRPNNKDLLKDLRKLDRLKVNLSIKSISKDIYSNLQEVLDLYEKRRQSKAQKNPYDENQRRQFVKEVTTAYEKSGNAELSLLNDQDGNVWAFQLDWLDGGIRYHWNHAYNEDYKKYSPGKILLYFLMKRSFQDPKEIQCNHMRGLAEYKRKLASQKEDLYTLKIENHHSIRNKLTNLASKAVGIRKRVTGR